MAVKYLRLKDNKALITCLSGDTKPTATTGYLLIEEDTGDVFYVSASAWVKNVTGGGGSAWGSITGTLSAQTDLQNALDGKANSLGGDDNYVTDAEKTKLTNLSGTNSGDNATNTQYSGLAASKLDATAFSGLTKISVGTSTPVGPNTGDLWVDTN